MTPDPPPGVWPEVHARVALFSTPYPADAVALADAHREEVAPRLVEALEDLAANPAQAPKDYMLHLYSMHLLGWWRDKRGLAPLLALGHLRDHALLDDLFGDHLTEAFGRCLGSMAGSDWAALKALAQDEHAYVWARSAALGGMRACVVEGDAVRDDVIDFLLELGEREAVRERREDDFLDTLVNVLADLCAREALPAIRRWFAEQLLDESYASLHDIEADIVRPFDQVASRLRQRRRAYVGEPEREMAWWACFTDGDEEAGGDIDWTPPVRQPYVRDTPKIGRNDPCPCGSGRKYKKCHGAVA